MSNWKIVRRPDLRIWELKEDGKCRGLFRTRKDAREELDSLESAGIIGDLDRVDRGTGGHCFGPVSPLGGVV